jgi:indole-3-glycerol phosphate synthase
MTGVLPDILARIVDHKQAELRLRRRRQAEFEALAETARAGRRDFRAALLSRPPAVIAECKKASPSKGLLAPSYDPVKTARQYEDGGAAAISVLTDEAFFQGSLADLQKVKASTRVPVLRKDFTLDEFHVVEAAAHGADAILLIAAILPAGRIRALREMAEHYAIAAIVEVHDEAEMDRGVEAGADIIGVNNRDLRTFDVRLETSEQLARLMPAGALRIAESGIQSPADIARLRAAGYDAFLVGEHLMKSGDPADAIRELRR